MTEFYTIQGVGKSFFECRVLVRRFNNKIKDAQLGRIYKDVPCRVCEDQILNEARELQKECDRFIKHYKKHEIYISLIAKGCCRTRSNENNDTIHQDSTCIKEVMSRMRTFLRDYNDHLDDLNYKNEDGRPCEKCRESLLQECQGLAEELNRINDQFQESSMKDKYPCDLRRAATESQDYSQVSSADTTLTKDPDKDVQTEMPSSSCEKVDIKGPCVTLEGSMDDSNNTDA